MFIIKTSSTWFHVNLILHPLHFLIQQLLHMKLSYPPLEGKLVFNLLHDEDFTILYITDTIQNPPASHQLLTKAKLNMWIISINGEEPITYQGELDELNSHKNTRGKSKVKISLCRRNIYYIIATNLIKSDLWFKILKFVSQRNLPHQRTLENF